MNTTTRSYDCGRFELINLAHHISRRTALNSQGSTLLDIRGFSWFNYKRQGLSFSHGSKYIRSSEIIYCQIVCWNQALCIIGLSVTVF